MRGSWRVRCRIKTKLALREQNSSGKRWKSIRACRFWVLWVIVYSRFEILSPAICLCFWNAWVLTYAVQHQIDMGTPGAKIIGEALKVNTSLLGLGLVSNCLFSVWDLLQGILLCIWNAWVLTCAVQGGNEIGDEGAKFIGEALKVNTSVQSLDLVSNCLFSFWDFVSSFSFVFLKCVGADVCDTGVQWYIRCGSKIHRGSAESQHERADSGSCE